jgi:diguanylate cyclase (GGDEF)-like protein
MKRTAVRRIALLAFVPLVLLAVWLYLYTHSRAVDTAEQGRTLALLKDLKQLDSDWSADVLRSHADLNPNYDALVEPLARFSASVARLRARAARLHDPALDAAVSAVDAAVAEKAALIDRFKAQNSLYKNSLRYVPTAQRDIQARQPTVDASLAFLVNETLRYCSVPDREVGETLPPLIAEERAALAASTPALREPVANLLKHLETLLRLRAGQGDLLRAISQVPVTARADALAAVFVQRFDAELAGQFRYQRLLLVYSAFALLLVISGTGFIGWRNATERRRLRSLVEEKTRELKDLATRDDLTRVHNRRHMAELLQQQIALHARSGQPVCVALLDIDLFKSINDRHGHAAGDEVLRRFAAIATRTLRTTDLLGRWGGEEFLVALPQTALEPAARTLHKLREVLAKAEFGDVAPGLRISFSGGLVQLGAGETIAAAVERADQAMYRAKTGGRNRIETAAPAAECRVAA